MTTRGLFGSGGRIYGPEEEAGLARTFGPAWDVYLKTIKLPWF